MKKYKDKRYCLCLKYGRERYASGELRPGVYKFYKLENYTASTKYFWTYPFLDFMNYVFTDEGNQVSTMSCPKVVQEKKSQFWYNPRFLS